jgi:hypothetical protein
MQTPIRFDSPLSADLDDDLHCTAGVVECNCILRGEERRGEERRVKRRDEIE